MALELYIGNLNSVEAREDSFYEGTRIKVGERKYFTTCVSFLAKSDKEAIKMAKELNLKDFGKVSSIKVKGRDY